MAEETDEEKLRKRHLRNQVSDFGASIPILMSSDTREDSQPDNTFRSALNAVIEDRNQLGTIQNEESNEVCFEIPSAGIQDNEDNILGQVIYNKCCVDEKPVMFYYTSSNVNSLVDSMNASCDGYVAYDDEWFVEEVNDYFTKQELKEFLVDNPGVYRISPSECFSTEIEIYAKGCCSSQTIFATAPFSFTESLAESLITCSAGDYMLPETGNKMKVSLIDSGGTMGEWTYYDSFPVVINRDAEVEVFCQNIDYDTYLMSIDVDDISVSGISFLPLESADCGLSNVLSYRCTNVESINRRCNIAFSYSGDYGIEDISISVNGNSLVHYDEPDNSRSQCWYISNGYIIVDFTLNGNNIYSFEFTSSKSSERKIINVEIRTRVEVYDENGAGIGYIDPTDIISSIDEQNFYIGSDIQESLVGNNDITSYYIYDKNGNRIISSTDSYPIDFKYNNIITVIIDEND